MKVSIAFDLVQAVATFGMYAVVHKWFPGGEPIYFLSLIYALQVRPK